MIVHTLNPGLAEKVFPPRTDWDTLLDQINYYKEEIRIWWKVRDQLRYAWKIRFAIMRLRYLYDVQDKHGAGITLQHIFPSQN